MILNLLSQSLLI